MAINFFEEGGLLNFYKAGGAIAIRKTNFHSHKNHNPDCDILEGYIDDDSFITYCVYVKDATHGSKKGDESMEYYSGENYVPGSKKRSNSKHFTVSEIPAKYLAAWNKLKEDYKANYAEIVVTPESISKLADGGKISEGDYDYDKIAAKQRHDYHVGDKVVIRNEDFGKDIVTTITDKEDTGDILAGVVYKTADGGDYLYTQIRGVVIEGDGDGDGAKLGADEKDGSDKEYIVTVMRTAWASHDFEVSAQDASEAAEMAIEKAGNIEFSSGQSNYEVDNVVRKDGESIYAAGGRVEKNWIVRTYDEDNKVIEWWTIKNRTENEARREAEAEIEQNFRDADDWTLTPMGYDDIKSDIEIFKGIVSDTEKIDDIVFAERFILENNLLSYDLNDDKHSSLRDLISVLKVKAKLFSWSLFKKKEQKELFDAAMLKKYADYKNRIGIKYAVGGGVKGSTVRANSSPLLRYANFEDGSHINLLKLIKHQVGVKNWKPYNNDYKYAISVSSIKDGQNVFNFKTLEQAEDRFTELVNEKKLSTSLTNEGVTNNYEKLETGEEKYVAVHENKSGYWTIASKPVNSRKIAEILAAGAPRGETGKVVTLKEAKEHKKVLGREYLEMETGGKVDKAFAKKKDAVIAYATKELAEGGEVKPIAPTEHYRYLEITKFPNGLELAINEEGREEVKEWQEDEMGDYEIMGELFDTVQGNSEYMWHENLGDQGFGLTSAPGITDGYYSDDDNGRLTDKGQEDSAELYSFMGYELHSPLELLLRDGKVFFARVPKGGDELDAKGVPVKKSRKGKK